MAKYGQSIVLSSILALLSYVPFQIVAKSSLIFCGLVFIFDPIPPTSRLLSLLCVIFVAILSKIERKWREGQEEFLLSEENSQKEEAFNKDD